jgi:hypothetical protein
MTDSFQYCCFTAVLPEDCSNTVLSKNCSTELSFTTDSSEFFAKTSKNSLTSSLGLGPCGLKDGRNVEKDEGQGVLLW